MNGTLTIAARELRERARVFAVCTVLAAVPFLASLLPGARGNRTDVIAAFGGFLSIAVGLGLAMSLGVSTIGRELSEKRMSFYFAKPVSPAAIWFGKATAALAVSLGCFALIAIPAYLATRDVWRVQWLGDTAPLAIGALMIVELFFVSHVLSSILRSRSILLAVDLVCLIGVLAALYLILRPLALGGSVNAIQSILVFFGVAASVILAIAPVWQLAQGRTDVRRGHAALSRFVWIAVAAVLVLASLYVAWIVSVDPQDLDEISDVTQSARGAGVVVSGQNTARGPHTSTFLVNQRTAAHERLVPQWWGSSFSDDGNVLFWEQPTGLFNLSRLELHATRLSDGRSVWTGITVHPYPSAMLPNADGSRLAVIENRTAVVYDVATGKLLAAGTRFDSRARHSLFFPSPDVVRIVEHGLNGSGTLRVFELDVPTRAIRKTGEQTYATEPESVSLSGDGTRMLVRGPNVLVDPRTGQMIAQLPINARKAKSALLHDGTLVSIDIGEQRLRMFSRDGQPLRDLLLPGVMYAYLAGEIEGGKLLVIGVDRVRTDVTGAGRKMFVIDVQRGVVERIVPDVKGPTISMTARLTRYAADQQFVAVNAEGKLVTWDPRTGAVQKL